MNYLVTISGEVAPAVYEPFLVHSFPYEPETPNLFADYNTTTSSTSYFIVGPSQPGYPGHSWTDVYYERIHVISRELQVGVVGDTLTFTVLLWNAAWNANAINTISATGDQGITLSGITLPQNFKQTQEITLTVIVTLDGPPVIEAFFSFLSSLGPAPSLKIDGFRGVVFPYEPDYSSPVTVRRFWQTISTESLDTAEERRSYSSRPLHGLKFSVLNCLLRESAHFKSRVLLLNNGISCVPLWTEAVRLTSPTTPADFTLNVESTTHADFAASEYVVIVENWERWAVKKVVSVLANSINLSAAIGKAFPAGSHVAPLLFGAIKNLPEFAGITDENSTTELEFEEEYL